MGRARAGCLAAEAWGSRSLPAAPSGSSVPPAGGSRLPRLIGRLTAQAPGEGSQAGGFARETGVFTAACPERPRNGQGPAAAAAAPAMPVRFKGLSEYTRNFKWKKSDLSEVCNPSREQKSSRAGLRSDQLGITREPNFISKRRVPYFNPQISKSFEWRGDSDLEGYLNDAPEVEGAGPAECHTDNHSNNRNLENIETPEAPRLPKKIRSHSADSRIESAIILAENSRKKLSPPTPVNQKAVFVPPKKHLEKMDNGFHRVLQKKSGMNISPSNSFPRNSEYQRQFLWKTPPKNSPMLAADQVIHNTSKSIPPFKSSAIIPETEYERSFKVSPPAMGPKLRCDLEEREFPECTPVNISPERKEGEH
ncbi:Neuronal-specific septin-3 [Platysternon megacephalum]|uniref:Nuclear protein MDM1 n=1 Tax=Platysternon megacephalum TaxID=55544 RepID=A0A4D9EH09_9SAUR|nr:Neuronal-specific septin-3 [Platysternon megacephalum]